MKGFFEFGSPIIELSIEHKNIKMLLDTGFNGYIMLPKTTIHELDLEQIGISDYLTASGEHRITNVYKAEIKFFDEEIEVSILSTDGDFSLAGMELFHECKIILERHNDIVDIVKSK